VSDVEQREIAKFQPNANVVILSNIHSLDPTPKLYHQRQGCVFVGGVCSAEPRPAVARDWRRGCVGNWNHHPNVDGVLWFAREILPIVSKRVDASFVFHVVGANPLPDRSVALPPPQPHLPSVTAAPPQHPRAEQHENGWLRAHLRPRVREGPQTNVREHARVGGAAAVGSRREGDCRAGSRRLVPPISRHSPG
jgi:hypothetical protein